MRDIGEQRCDQIPIPVGPHFFTLCMVCGPLYNEDGNQCMARVDYDARSILVDEALPSHIRAAVGAAAAAHAWQRFTRPVPLYLDLALS